MTLNNNRSLAAVIACRNQGSRLYGKPLQPLCIKSKYCILDQVINNIKKIKCIKKTILAISEGVSNTIYVEYK